MLHIIWSAHRLTLFIAMIKCIACKCKAKVKKSVKHDKNGSYGQWC